MNFAKRQSPHLLLFLCVVSFGATDQATGQDIQLHDCVVQFAREVRVPALASGRIVGLSVKVNQSVVTNDRIAKLDDRSLLIRRSAATLRLQAAKDDAIDNLGLRYAETSLAEAEAELETSRNIQADVKGAIPQSQLRKLRLAVERGHLEVAQASRDMRRQQVEVALRESELSTIDAQLRNLHMESPIEGVVLNLNRENGEWIERGEPIATVAQLDKLHIHALAEIGDISPSECKGMAVTVHWTDDEKRQQTLLGTVLSTDPQVLPGERFRLHAEVVNQRRKDNPTQWRLVPGTNVNMRLKR